jgi:hypothetical protein
MALTQVQSQMLGGNNAAVPTTTGVGNQALNSNSGASNTAVGYQAGYSNTTGTRNVHLGLGAGYTQTTASGNTFVGQNAGRLTTGQGNTFIGYEAGYSVTTGNNNTFIGPAYAGINGGVGDTMTTGSNNVIIGRYTGNQGGLDIRTSNNTIVLSDGDGNPRAWIGSSGNLTVTRSDFSGIQCPGCYNDTTGSAANVFITSGGSLVRSTSSLKYKKDVQDATFGLTDVLNLRPVTYKTKSQNDNDQVFGGLIAEEVHEAGLTEFVQYAEDGTPDALNYGNMVSLCFKAIQEQQAIITDLKARIETLEAK